MQLDYQLLPVAIVDFDTNNPRIKMALEKYGDELTAERIHFALRSATDGSRGTSSYTSLRDSIRASRGVMDPIRVTSHDDRYICIDGNTRLAIYKQFQKEHVPGDWSRITAIIIDNPTPVDVETIRVSAHLVGAREWPAYEKARYLHHLRTEELMDYSEMIALCGGNKTEIERQIDAYHDMNEHYRDLVDDTAFHIDRFSGFVELQKPTIKESIFDAGLALRDFGEWIRDGKIYRLEDVRQLPRVLGDHEARTIFLNGGPRSIERAVKLLDDRSETRQPTNKITLNSASIKQLADVLSRRINEMPYSEVRTLRTRETDDALDYIRTLEDLHQRLQHLLEDVSD